MKSQETNTRHIGNILFSMAFVILAGITISQPSWSMCKEGTISNCVVNGKHGTRECVGGHLTPCLVEPDETPVVHGSATPKYYILTVLYAPPGTAGGKSSSSVEYSNGSTTGSTVSSSSSFKTDTKVSASATGGIFASATVGASFGVSAKEGDSSKLEVKKSTTTTIKDAGPSVDGIDHDRDIIYLLLNPKIDITISGKNVTWNLGHTGSTADLQYVYVGWLKNPSQMPPGLNQKFTSLGFTAADYQTILSADPFATGNTSIDQNRFAQTDTTFPYEPPYAQGETGPTMTFVQKNDLTSTQSHSYENSYSVGMSVGGEVGFTSLFKTTLKVENNWTWTNSGDSSSSSTSSESATVTIGGPAFGYTGPTDMAVYYDTLYKTFMFHPMSVTTYKAKGTIKFKKGTAAIHREVFLYAGGKRYRTFTNSRGEYHFPGQFTGTMDIEVKGLTKKRVPTSKQLNFTLPDRLIIRPEPLKIIR